MSDRRWLPIDEAVWHVGTTESVFRKAVKCGKFPPPSYVLGKQSPRWDRDALDRAMGADDAVENMGETINAVAEQIKAAAQGRQKAPGRRLDQNL